MDLELVDRARSPASRCGREQAQGGITVRLAPGDPDSVEIRFFDEDGADIDEGAQRKIERLLVPRGLPARVRRRHRRHRVPAAGARVLHGRARGERRHRAAPAPRVQGRARLLVRRDVDRDAERARQARRRRARGQPVRGDASARSTVDDREHAGQGRSATSCARRAPISGCVFDPDGETATIIDDQGVRALAPTRRCSRSSSSSCEQRPGARLALPVSVSREAERHRASARRARSRGRSCRRRTSWRSRGSGGRRLRRVAGRRLHLARRSCPRTTRRPRSCTCSTCSPRADARCRRSSPACPSTHVAHEAVADAVGAQGHGDARDGRAGEGPPDRARRRREDRLPRRVGARAARPRGRDHARVGRGRERRRGAAASSRSTPVRSPSSAPVATGYGLRDPRRCGDA